MFPETLRNASRKSDRFRLRAYRTVQTRPVSSRSVHPGVFPDVYFYTQSLQRPQERRPMASRREQVSALFFVAWTQRRLTECFPWATEGPNPPMETLTFKKEFFGKQLRDHYPRALKIRWRAIMKCSVSFKFQCPKMLSLSHNVYFSVRCLFHFGKTIDHRKYRKFNNTENS